MKKTAILALTAAAVAMASAALVDAEKRWDAARGYWVPNNDESKVGPYTLEDPLTFLDGTKVKSPADWPRRRAEILGIFAKEMFGEEPPKPKTLVTDVVSEKVTADGYAIRRIVKMYFRGDRTGPCITWGVWIPRFAKGKVPAVEFLTYRGLHELVMDDDIPVSDGWSRNNPANHISNHRASEKTRGRMCDQNQGTVFPLQMILARGYAVIASTYTEVSPDPNWNDKEVDQYQFATTNGVFTLWGKRDESRTDNITSLGAWAWALSRGIDLAERMPEIDAKKIVVTGCSRLGKSALLAAARDERFAVCVPNQCGGGGVCLAKRDFGENVSTEIKNFTHWYCKAYAKYAPDPAKLLTFDQHLLVAAIAPRPILVEGFGPNDWMDTKAEYLACKAASPAWELFGLQGLPGDGYPDFYDTSAIGRYLGYVRRTQSHGISGYDWTWLLDFADKALK